MNYILIILFVNIRQLPQYHMVQPEIAIFKSKLIAWIHSSLYPFCLRVVCCYITRLIHFIFRLLSSMSQILFRLVNRRLCISIYRTKPRNGLNSYNRSMFRVVYWKELEWFSSHIFCRCHLVVSSVY